MKSLIKQSRGLPLQSLKHRLAKIALTAGQVGGILGAVFFVFQVVQTWVDAGISKSMLRWAFPTGLSIATFVILGGLFALLNFRGRKDTLPAPEKLALAVIEYARHLQSEARDQAILTLRNSFSRTLHHLGFHEIRAQVGEISLQSATILNDTATKAEILIDDLGWANYLLGNKDIAIVNIQRGVTIAAEAKTTIPDKLVRLALCEGKGLRHLAIIANPSDSQEARSKLDQAMQVLTSLDVQSSIEVNRDIAQLHHARALTTAMSLDIHRSGRLRRDDTQGIQLVNEALERVREAASIFKNTGDLDRYVKALYLEVRLLEAKNADGEAKEVAALRDRTVAMSEWARPEGRSSITGV